MKKLVLAVSLGLASNAYALDAEKETLWVMQQVSAICSAHDIGEMADDYWDVVKDIQNLIGADYDPHDISRGNAKKHVMRAAVDPAICYQSYGRVVNHVNEYKNS